MGPFRVVEYGQAGWPPLDVYRYDIKTQSTADKYPLHVIFMPSVRVLAARSGLDPWQVARRFRANLIIDVDPGMEAYDSNYTFSAFDEDTWESIRINHLDLTVMSKTKRCGFVNLSPQGLQDKDSNVLGHLAKLRQEQGYKGAPTFGLHLAVTSNEQTWVEIVLKRP